MQVTTLTGLDADYTRRQDDPLFRVSPELLMTQGELLNLASRLAAPGLGLRCLFSATRVAKVVSEKTAGTDKSHRLPRSTLEAAGR